MNHVIAHVDMDGFFASCEEVCNPDLRRVPLAVCGGIERGVVTASNKIAKANYGLKTAMSISSARRLSGNSPDVVFLPGDMEKYLWFSKRLNELMREFTPAIEPYSIDEMFLDMTGCPAAADLETMGLEIKRLIREDLGLPSTIGIGPNRFLAKMGTEAGKPDGLVVMTPERFKKVFWKGPPSALWGIGGRGEANLLRLGIATVEQLANYPVDLLKKHFGQPGIHYWMMANGVDLSSIGDEEGAPNKSFGNSRTLDRDTDDPAAIERLIFALSDKVSRRMRAEECAARTIGTWLRASDYETVYGAQTSLPDPIDDDVEIYRVASAIRRGFSFHGKVRAAGVWCANLVRPYRETQGLLFKNPHCRLALAAADRIRDKHGEATIARAFIRDPEDRRSSRRINAKRS